MFRNGPVLDNVAVTCYRNVITAGAFDRRERAGQRLMGTAQPDVMAYPNDTGVVGDFLWLSQR